MSRKLLIFDSKKGTAAGHELEIAGILPMLVFSIYPKPSNEKFQFTINDLDRAENTELEIYNRQGEKIYQSAITNLKHIIDLRSQSAGIYFMEINGGKTILK